MNKSLWSLAGLIAAVTAAGCGSGSPKPADSPTMATTYPMTLPTMIGLPPAGAPPAGSPTAPATSLKFSPASLDAIVAGTKTSTTRTFRRVTVGPIQATDGARVMTLTVTSVTNKPFSELTEDDAKADGSVKLDTLKEHLTHDYPKIGPNEQMTVVRFIAPPK